MKSLQLTKPHLLIVAGVPGSGKTQFAEKFSETFHAPFINGSDVLRLTTEPKLTAEIIQMMLAEVLKTNQTVIYEPIGGTRNQRAEIAKLAHRAGYKPLVVWVQTDRYVAQARATRKSRTNPHPISDESFERALKRFTPPNRQENSVVISGMHTYASQARVVLKKLTEQIRRDPTPPSRDDGSKRRTVMVQ